MRKAVVFLGLLLMVFLCGCGFRPKGSEGSEIVLKGVDGPYRIVIEAEREAGLVLEINPDR